MTLLSPSQLRSIQKLGESGMTTTVTIRNRQPFAKDPSNPNGDENPGLGSPVTVKGWVAPILDNDFGVEGQRLVSSGEFKLRVPVGTEIHPGDEATIAGETYAVVDSNFEATWPEWTQARIRKNQ